MEIDNFSSDTDSLVFLTNHITPTVEVCSIKTFVPLLKEFLTFGSSTINVLSIKEQTMFMIRTIMKMLGSVNNFRFSFYQVEKDDKLYDILGKKYFDIYESSSGGITVPECKTIYSSRLNDLYKHLRFKYCRDSLVRVLSVRNSEFRIRFFDVSSSVRFPTHSLLRRFEQFLKSSEATLLHCSYIPFFSSQLSTDLDEKFTRRRSVVSVSGRCGPESTMLRNAILSQSKLLFSRGRLRVNFSHLREIGRILKFSHLEIERYKRRIAEKDVTIQNLRKNLRDKDAQVKIQKSTTTTNVSKNNKKKQGLSRKSKGKKQPKKKKRRQTKGSSGNKSTSSTLIVSTTYSTDQSSKNKTHSRKSSSFTSKKKKKSLKIGDNNIIRKKKRTSGMSSMNTFNYAIDYRDYEEMMRSVETEHGKKKKNKSSSGSPAVDWKKSYREMNLENKTLKKRIYDLEISKSEILSDKKEMSRKHHMIQKRLEEDILRLKKQQEEDLEASQASMRKKYESEIHVIKGGIQELVSSHQEQTGLFEESNHDMKSKLDELKYQVKTLEGEKKEMEDEQTHKVRSFNQYMQEKLEEVEDLKTKNQELRVEMEKKDEALKKSRKNVKNLTLNLSSSKEQQKKVKLLLKDLLNHLEISENKNLRNEEEVEVLRMKISELEDESNKQKRMLKDCSVVIKKFKEKNMKIKGEISEKLRSTFERERENSKFIKVLEFHIRNKKNLGHEDLGRLLRKSEEIKKGVQEFEDLEDVDLEEILSSKKKKKKKTKKKVVKNKIRKKKKKKKLWNKKRVSIGLKSNLNVTSPRGDVKKK